MERKLQLTFVQDAASAMLNIDELVSDTGISNPICRTQGNLCSRGSGLINRTWTGRGQRAHHRGLFAQVMYDVFNLRMHCGPCESREQVVWSQAARREHPDDGATISA